ncbi:MAG: PVC-type heme-binding CxxCH protein [Rhodothermales bacterium]
MVTLCGSRHPEDAPVAAIEISVFLLLLVLLGCGTELASGPDALDDRIEVTLVASDPQIVTPIGLAVDDRDRLFVLESHTHLEPSDYDGPDGDLVKIFSVDGDSLRHEGIFADGIDDGMNIAFAPNGALYVVAAQAVWAFRDRDGDGVSDERERVLNMDPPDYVYDHAGLMGIAFSDDGWMYVSRGNVGGAAWHLTGTDGSWVEGFGDGGNIVRARLDGSDVQEVATGFWNPFHLFVDSAGRLIATDNDPDSRGPNRLLHIIEGGDYGYESLYGGSGIHPYLAWNGELPGTLPYAAGLGEAPTACLELESESFPSDYNQSLLCAIWEESTIVHVRLSPRGSSIQGEIVPVIRGDATFRPVVMAATSDGDVYVTDWVVRDYPNHGRGRIWRLSASEASASPGRGSDAPTSSEATTTLSTSSELDAIYSLTGLAAFPQLRAALTSDDPFVRTAAVTVLTRPIYRDRVVEATHDGDADVRLGALLALQRAKHTPAEPVARRLLRDPDVRIRRMALIWIGKAGMVDLRSDVESVVNEDMLPSALFDTYLATIRHLQPAFVEAYHGRTNDRAGQIERRLPDGFVARFAADERRPSDLRAASLAYLTENGTRLDDHFDLLVRVAGSDSDDVRRQAVLTLARTTRPERADVLLEIAEDPDTPPELRAEALLGLSGTAIDAERITALLDDPSEGVRVESARLLRTLEIDETVRDELETRFASLRDAGTEEAPRVRQQLAMVLDRPSGDRPDTPEEWLEAARRGGDPDIGRRVFFWPQAQCTQCHTVDHLGGDVGPDLSNVGASKSLEQLVASIVAPSSEIAPDWQTWFVVDSTGTRHLGRQINVGGNSVELYTIDGRFTDFETPLDWGISDRSLMPEELHGHLTTRDFRDLIAYLQSNR